MPSAKDKHVLVVDDSPVDMEFLTGILQETFSLSSVNSGKEALKLLEQGLQPDIILLDLYMPEMTGYEACEAIRSKYGDKDIIFVSSNDSTEEILKGYSVGAIDYIVKPFDAALLTSKVSLAINNREILNNLKTTHANANKLVMDAMTYSGELGIIISYQRQCFLVNNIYDLCETLMEAICQVGLNCCVQITENDKIANNSDAGVVCELESELMSRASAMEDRFFTSGTRTFIRYEDIVILIKNMPIEDEEKTGRLRDILLTMAESAQSRIKSFSVANQFCKPVVCDYSNTLSEEVKADISNLVGHIEGTYESLEQEKIKYTDQSSELVDNILHEVESAFYRLGLTEGQERELLKIINNAVDKSLSHYEEDIKLDHQLKSIATQLLSLSTMH